MPVPALIGGALSIGGALLSSSSSNKNANQAAGIAQQTANQNNAVMTQQLQPFTDRGNWAGNALTGMLGLHSDQAWNDKAADQFGQYIKNSDYGFQFSEGSNALNSGYAGAGALQSGAAMKELEGYRQNLQAGYRNEFTNQLGAIDARGLGSAASLAAGISSNNNSAGSAAANAALSKTNPFANALGSIGGGLMGYAR